MLKIAVLVSGGGTNLQAIIDGVVKAVELFHQRAKEHDKEKKAGKENK